MPQVRLLLPSLALCLCLSGYAQSQSEMFSKVQSIFNARCIKCHGSEEPAAGMSLEEGSSYKNLVNVPSGEDPDLKRISPNQPANSYLFRKIMREQDRLPFKEDGMPGEADKLPDNEINTIQDWISSFPTELWGSVQSVNVTSAAKTETPGDEAFLATQLINLPTTRVLGKKTAEFRILHRFGLINGGGGNTFGSFFGLDNGAFTSINLSVALTSNIDFLIRRQGNPTKDFEFAFKYVPFQRFQNWPVSLGIYAGADWISRKDVQAKNRFSPNLQLLIGADIHPKFSLLVVPTLAFKSDHNDPIIRNGVEYKDTRSTLAVGIGGQYQFIKNASINAEYVPRFSGYRGLADAGDPRFNTWSLGLMYKIRLHVFQVLISNTQFMNTTLYVPGSSAIYENKIYEGGFNFHFGFNIIRQFKW